jgi:hypothetical protein
VRFKAKNTIKLSVALILVISVITGYARTAFSDYIIPVIIPSEEAPYRNSTPADTTDYLSLYKTKELTLLSRVL